MLAQNTLKYLLPQIGELEPEQILELREAVADYREGFSMHLQSLSAGIDDRVKGNESISEIIRFAENIIDTQLVPDYREFLRILKSKEKKHKGQILDIAGRILEIDAPFGSPKFFAQLLRAFGNALEADADEQEKRLTNRNQAYHLMRTVEAKTNI